MYDELRKRVDELFIYAPKTSKAMELKEELTANLIEKYDDLIKEGKSDEEALKGAMAGVGDVSSLIASLKEEYEPTYEELKRESQRSALFISVAVGLYIFGVALLILLAEVFGTDGVVGLVAMLTVDAVATGLLIYNANSRPKYLKESRPEEKDWSPADRERNNLLRSVKSILWTLIVVVYFLVSFIFSAWAFSWIIFIIGVALEKIVVLVFQLKER
ncbi:MAG: permease prefix domain 1-containing protein [Clostridiaceae bacterium]